MASVNKQSNNRWRVMWYDKDKRRRSKTFVFRPDAEEFCNFLNGERPRTDHIKKVESSKLWRDPRCIIKA